MLENMGWIVGGAVAVVGWAIHAMKISHAWGGLDQRMKAIEASVSGHQEVRDSVIRMEAELKSMTATLAELKDSLVWLTKSAPMYGPPAPPAHAPRARAAK